MTYFTTFQQFDIAAHAYAHDGATVYRGKPEYAGRYIVGGLATKVVPHEAAGYAAMCLDAVFDLADDASTVKAETLGVWHDNGLAYFDLGDTYYTKERALMAARERGELAIWDRHTSTEITA